MKEPTVGPKGSKLLFVVFIHQHSPEKYERLWERGLRRIEKWAEDQFRQDDESLREKFKEQTRNSYKESNLYIHRYNDIAGFAEVYWNGSLGIEVNYIFRANGRTRSGRRAGRGLLSTNPRRFYLTFFMADRVDASIPVNAEGLKKATFKALERVEKTAVELKCWTDVSHERLILQHLDLRPFLEEE